MKTQIRLLTTIFLTVLVSCGGSDDGPSNTAPSQVTQVVFPTADLLCTDNNVNFQWNAATDADGDSITYRVVIATDRSLVDVVENRTASTNNITITLQQGVAYYWNVTAIDDSGAESMPSTTLAFFTSGPGITNYAPFTAELNTPVNESTVTPGTVTLSWTGADTDVDDTLTYDLFFGTTDTPPETESDLTIDNLDVTVTSGVTYFWRVDSTDDSGFKTLGQLWSFTAN